MDRLLTIVIPVYNEGANFPALWSEMTEHLDFPFTAFVAYDFDGDNTLPAVQEILAQGETRLKLVKNTYGRGVVGAIRTGFDAAPPGPVLVLMADLSDDLGQVRHYTYGGDLARGIRVCVEHPAALNQDFNLSTPVRTTVLELAELIWKKIHGSGKPFHYVSDPAYEYDVQERAPAVGKARDLLGFEAATPLSDILDEVIPWIAEQVEIGQM